MKIWMKGIKAESKTEYALRALFLGSYRPTESKKDAAMIAVYYALGAAILKATKVYQSRRLTKAELTQDFLDVDPFLPGPRKRLPGSLEQEHDDLMVDLDLAIIGTENFDDYWHWSAGFRTYLPNPNPFPKGSVEHARFYRVQDATSF